MKLADSTTNCKRYVYLSSHFLHHIRESLATFVTCCNVEEDQFVCSLLTVYLAQLYRVACLPKLQEVRALDSLSVFDVKARYDSLC